MIAAVEPVAAVAVTLMPPEAAEKRLGAFLEDTVVETAEPVEVVLDELEGPAMIFVMPLTTQLEVRSNSVAVAILAGLAEAVATAERKGLVAD